MIRVLIVDDEALVRAGLRMILEPADGIEVAGEATDGDELADAVRELRPDVVLLDVRMPRVDGLTALEEIASWPDAPRYVMLTTFDLDQYVHRALRLGAAGFLLKDTPPRDLAAAIRTVADGGAMLAPTVTTRLIAAFTGRDPAKERTARDRLATLTDRERAVVVKVGDGLSNADIAHELQVSEATVKAHVSRSMTKLDLANRVQLAILVQEAEFRSEEA
ncbi:response regulator [Amycolatopsis sp. CA-230715]|uniref:response regulator n=1 Tax=Amycolatopsis sp. CA-230715 TaxID=2745196 RepID=UPI001C00F305|nr:response regulator transcription factor [Amycolatopsis sp. CA-230715]QWF81824.1 Transcriptional regulatory protein DegU [Amycolatopsis sp. CA-230715]